MAPPRLRRQIKKALKIALRIWRFGAVGFLGQKTRLLSKLSQFLAGVRFSAPFPRRSPTQQAPRPLSTPLVDLLGCLWRPASSFRPLLPPGGKGTHALSRKVGCLASVNSAAACLSHALLAAALTQQTDYLLRGGLLGATYPTIPRRHIVRPALT